MDIATRAPVEGPTFIRLLARIAGSGGQPSGIAPSQRLGEWIDWTRAIALSRALEQSPEPPPPPPRGDDPAGDVARARRALQARIGDREAWEAALADPGEAGFAGLRKRHVAIQHALQASAGRLRGDLRDRLAGGSPAQARLAALDAVMEQVASPREQQLLAAVPDLLRERHAQLRAAADRDAGDLLAQAVPADDGWRHALCQDMQELLLAELDVRFMPIDGLLAALQSR